MIRRRGPADPTLASVGGVIWSAFQTEDGVVTLALRRRGDEIVAAAWGPGAQRAIAAVPRLCGADDDPSAFDPGPDARVRDWHRRNPGLRLGASDQLSAELVGCVLEQKVTGLQAFGAWRYLVQRFGTVAPGPTPRRMSAAPTMDLWRSVPSWAWHRAGVEPAQSRVIAEVSQRGDRLLRAIAAAPTGAEQDRLLLAQRGIGPWTSAEVRLRTFGDPDAVSVGDYHLSHAVGYALTGRRTDDAGMLALLRPWAGQRQRVIRLIRASGPREPRRAARLHPEDHRSR